MSRNWYWKGILRQNGKGGQRPPCICRFMWDPRLSLVLREVRFDHLSLSPSCGGCGLVSHHSTDFRQQMLHVLACIDVSIHIWMARAVGMHDQNLRGLLRLF